MYVFDKDDKQDRAIKLTHCMAEKLHKSRGDLCTSS